MRGTHDVGPEAGAEEHDHGDEPPLDVVHGHEVIAVSDGDDGAAQTLGGSFSAVSNPIFTTKYALESASRDLHNL